MRLVFQCENCGEVGQNRVDMQQHESECPRYEEGQQVDYREDGGVFRGTINRIEHYPGRKTLFRVVPEAGLGFMPPSEVTIEDIVGLTAGAPERGNGIGPG